MNCNFYCRKPILFKLRMPDLFDFTTRSRPTPLRILNMREFELALHREVGLVLLHQILSTIDQFNYVKTPWTIKPISGHAQCLVTRPNGQFMVLM